MSVSVKRNANTGLTDHLGGKLHVGYMEVRNKLHAIRVRADVPFPSAVAGDKSWLVEILAILVFYHEILKLGRDGERLSTVLTVNAEGYSIRFALGLSC